jgi:hypothetical protein
MIRAFGDLAALLVLVVLRVGVRDVLDVVADEGRAATQRVDGTDGC